MCDRGIDLGSWLIGCTLDLIRAGFIALRALRDCAGISPDPLWGFAPDPTLRGSLRSPLELTSFLAFGRP